MHFQSFHIFWMWTIHNFFLNVFRYCTSRYSSITYGSSSRFDFSSARNIIAAYFTVASSAVLSCNALFLFHIVIVTLLLKGTFPITDWRFAGFIWSRVLEIRLRNFIFHRCVHLIGFTFTGLTPPHKNISHYLFLILKEP